MKMKRLERIAAALALCFAAPLFAVDSNALVEAAKKGDAAAIKPLLAEERRIFFNGRRRIHGLQIFSARQARIQPFWPKVLAPLDSLWVLALAYGKISARSHIISQTAGG